MGLLALGNTRSNRLAIRPEFFDAIVLTADRLVFGSPEDGPDRYGLVPALRVQPTLYSIFRGGPHDLHTNIDLGFWRIWTMGVVEWLHVHGTGFGAVDEGTGGLGAWMTAMGVPPGWQTIWE